MPPFPPPFNLCDLPLVSLTQNSFELLLLKLLPLSYSTITVIYLGVVCAHVPFFTGSVTVSFNAITIVHFVLAYIL